jgi:hypothetical protein
MAKAQGMLFTSF